MDKILHIFDVSPFIHAGAVNSYAKFTKTVDVGSTWVTRVTPAGGISLIFNKLYEICATGDIVFCCDRNPTIKKDMLEGYKGNREHKHEIEVNKLVAEYILQLCKGTVIARAGYEADDIIYSLIKDLKDKYDEIYIYTSDSDLYFLVDDKVSIKASSSRAKDVNRYTYEQTKIKGKCYKYNTITVSKILHGDTSDCVPSLTKEQIRRLEPLLTHDAVAPMAGDRDTIRELVEYYDPDVLPQVDVIFPIYIENLPHEFSLMDYEMMCNIGRAMNNKIFRNLGGPTFDATPYIDEMQARGYYLEDD